MNAFFSHWRRTLFFVFFLALLTRGIFVVTQQDGFYFPDSADYSETAIKLLSVREFGANYAKAPGYPLFLAAVYLLFGESIFAIRVVESFMGALLAVIMAAVGRRVGGEIVGALAGMIWAVYPIGVFTAGLVYPTGLAAMLLACGVYCLLPDTPKELSAKRAFRGGLFFGLAALTIPVALLTIVVVAGWVFYWARHSRLFFASLLLLGSAVSLGPWTARNFLVHGRLIPVQVSFQEYVPKTLTRQTNLRDNSVDANWRRAELYAGHFGRNFVGFWELYPSRMVTNNQGYRDRMHAEDSRLIRETIYRPNLLINAASIFSTGPIFLFALFGTVAVCLRRDLMRELSLLWIMALSFAVGYAFFIGKIRYRIPVEPYLIILSAYGINATYVLIATRFKSVLVPSESIITRRST